MNIEKGTVILSIKDYEELKDRKEERVSTIKDLEQKIKDLEVGYKDGNPLAVVVEYMFANTPNGRYTREPIREVRFITGSEELELIKEQSNNIAMLQKKYKELSEENKNLKEKKSFWKRLWK